MSDDVEVVFENINVSKMPRMSIEHAQKIKLETNIYIKEHYKKLEETHTKNISPKTIVSEHESSFIRSTDNSLSEVSQHVTNSFSDTKDKRKLQLSKSSESLVKKIDPTDDWNTLMNVTNVVGLQDSHSLDYLEFCIQVVLNNSTKHLISGSEKDIIQSFLNMDHDCKYTFATMYPKRYKCRRFSDYQNNTFALKNIHILVEKGFLLTDASCFDVYAVLEIMKLSEVKKLCNVLGIICNHPKKSIYLQEIFKYLKLQKVTGMEDISKNIRECAMNIMGPCFMLSPELCELFLRIYFIFHVKCNEKEQCKSSYNVPESSKSEYPDYIIDRTAKIFNSRDELMRFQGAVNLWMKFSETMKEKRWIAAEDILCTIRNNYLSELINSSISASQLPLCLREYTSGSLYIYTLYKGVEVLRKLKNQEQAKMDLALLIDQMTYLPYFRGRWYEQIINIYQTCGQIEEAAKIISKARNDPHVDERCHYILSSCTVNILKKKKGVSAEIKAMLQCVPPLSPENCKETCVIKSIVHRRDGCLQYSVQEDENQKLYSSTEELTKHHYCSKHFKNGIQCGNNMISSLFGILFWDMIYDCPVPCAFISLYQTIPLDLTTGEFYKNRQASIDRKLYEMTQWTTEEVVSWVKEIYYKQKDRKSMVMWELFQDLDYIMDIITSIGWNILLKICKRFAQNYGIACCGFPELFVWNPGQKNQYKFVQVHLPRAKLLPNHKLWQTFLLEINANIEICFIRVQYSETIQISADCEVQSSGKSQESENA